MKKSYLFIFLGIIAVIIGALVYLGKVDSMTNSDLLQFGVIGLLVILALYFGIDRLKSYNRNEPPEDELSKSMLQKAAAKSYYISLYLWLAVIYITDGKDIDTESVIGTGIVGMGITFFVSWLVIRYQGLRDA